MGSERVAGLVSLERGEVDRRIFSDPEIFEREMDLIFGRAWLFLCHESQIPKAGDFFEAPMGRDNVLVVRQKDGGIKGLLNTCTHRGNAVCRAEEGNTKNFMCTYHGWTFDLAGNLVGVPGLTELFHDDLDREALGLAEVAQLDSYHGFVFATADPAAPALPEFLGATGRLAFDLLRLRGDLEVVPGIQKFVIPCNWKFAVDNLFDFYHPRITHMSATGLVVAVPQNVKTVDSGGATTPEGLDIDAAAGQVTVSTESIVILGEFGHAISGPTRAAREIIIPAESSIGPIFNQEYRDTVENSEILGPVGSTVAGHPNIFPTAWISNLQISLRIPRSVNETEVWWFTFVPREWSSEVRSVAIDYANHVFGPAGLLEQEDGENWVQSTMQTVGYRSRQVPQVLKMNLGRGKVVKEHGLARIDANTSEHPQLWMYAAWQEWMSGCGWDELRAATIPPDVM